MSGDTVCSRCWKPWHPAGTPCESERPSAVDTLVDAVLDEACGYRIDRAILTVALSRALPVVLEREAGR